MSGPTRDAGAAVAGLFAALTATGGLAGRDPSEQRPGHGVAARRRCTPRSRGCGSASS